jgi:Domain of unknown function (DUF4157)
MIERTTKLKPSPPVRSARSALLQRKAAYGSTPGPTGECEECREKRLQRKARNSELGNRNHSSVPPIVHEVLRSPGQPLDAATRAFLEPRFGHDFSEVRVHTDAKASKSVRAVNARAYTVGNDIVFGDGQFNPKTYAGQELVAHELAHVAQQGTMDVSAVTQVSPAHDPLERQADAAAQTLGQTPAQLEWMHPSSPVLQRKEIEGVAKEIKGGGATPGKGEGVDLIFIIRAPDDQFTNDVTDYVKTVLHGQTFIEVDNLDEIFEYLGHLKARVNVFEVIEPAIKVRRIRIVAHGSTTGDVKMTPKGEKNRRWVHPQEVLVYAQSPLAQSTIAQVIAPGAQIEFWGCNVGAIPETGEAWSKAFHAEFTATSETFKTGFDDYMRPADRGERGEQVPGHKGTWISVTNTAEIDSRSKGLQKSFNAWLTARYAEFVANGDILPIKDQSQRLTYMRELFDRARGKMRHIVVMQKSDKSLVRPGTQRKWLSLWKTTPAPKEK